jgi:hypothetical protein
MIIGWIGLAIAIIVGIVLGVHAASHPCTINNPNWRNC